MSGQPITRSGREFFRAFAPFLKPSLMQEQDIAAIEQEARQQERERLAPLVNAIEHPCHEACVGNLHADCQCAAFVRESVLALLREEDRGEAERLAIAALLARGVA